MGEEEEKLPRIRLESVFSLREKIMDDSSDFVGCTVGGDTITNLMARLVRLIPNINVTALRTSLASLAGTKFDEHNFFDLAWRFAGNAEKLCQENTEPVLPWFCQRYPEWCPLEIIAGRYHSKPPRRGEKKRRPGHVFRMQVLAGSPCPLMVEKFWSIPEQKYLAGYLGYSAPWGERPFELPFPAYEEPFGHPFVRFRLFGLFEQSDSRKPFFKTVRCTSGMLTYNRNIINWRRRIDYQCPHDFTHACVDCEIGYLECMAGTHPYNFTVKHCVACGGELFHDPDPGFPSGLCLDCQWRSDSGLPYGPKKEKSNE